MHESRFIVGIDLGTTNIALTYIDTESNDRSVQEFMTLQLSGFGETMEAPLFPAFCFMPEKSVIPEDALTLPWENENDFGLGLVARNLGPEYPAHFISSAKSWLCHAGVDRRAEILPWNSSAVNKLSPLQVTQLYLHHLIEAWNHQFASEKDAQGNPCLLSDQQVTITIPASFDETARELTLEAARNAGFKHLMLLEEPLAVFYAWINENRIAAKDLTEKDRVLVIDIGGGTSDFSIIETNSEGNLTRTAAGEHLLLGGDNIDIALATSIEKEWQRKLTPSEWTTLCQKTRQAKEEILSDVSIDSVPITMIMQGSSVIGNTCSSEVTREKLEQLLFTGFIPEIGTDSPNPATSAALKTMGLPYAKDPAISRHILAFLRYAAKVTGSEDTTPLYPSHILFNGGSMIPQTVRDRIVDIIANWFPEKEKPQEINNRDLTTAVACGASYFGYTKRGHGVKVKSGTARSYYLKVTADDGKPAWICIMPRGVDENHTIECGRTFNLRANQTVSFPLYCSSTRINDNAGEVITNDDELTLLADMATAINFGRNLSDKLDAHITAELNETGVLEIALKSCETDHIWPLRFDIRLISSDSKEQQKILVIDRATVEKGEEVIKEAFLQDGTKLTSIFKLLEQIICHPRKQWPVAVLRRFSDKLLEIPYSKLLSKQAESRWLNLCGFCLRPGFGDPGDEIRIKKVWRIWLQGMNNPNDPQVAADWWIFWRRVAGGMRPGHQETVFSAVAKTICPKNKYREHVKEGVQAKAEMWRALGSFEHIASERKEAVGNVLAERAVKLNDFELWCLARLGTRRLFHAPINRVISSNVAANWIKSLIDSGEGSAMNQFAITRIGAKCGDRSIDIPDDTAAHAIEYLLQKEAGETAVKHLNAVVEETANEQGKILGDALPLGLHLKN